MIPSFIFCSSINFIDWLQNHLIACPFKAVTGIDCPGCGFQRSLIALFQGDLYKSWSFYPPTIPIILLFAIVGVLYKFPVKHQSSILKCLCMVVGNFILISYIHKMLMA